MNRLALFLAGLLFVGACGSTNAQDRAAQLLDDHWRFQQGDPTLIMETSIAKYFASRVAVKVAADAVQIHGANGCSDRYPVQRYLRDAKIMEIIEGSNQMQQIIIAKYGYQDHIMNQRTIRRQLRDSGSETK